VHSKTVSFVIDAALKVMRTSKLGFGVSWWNVLYTTVRTHVAFVSIASFHLVRYYFMLSLIFGLFYLSFAAFGFTILRLAALCDYCLKKPALSLPLFAWHYITIPSSTRHINVVFL